VKAVKVGSDFVPRRELCTGRGLPDACAPSILLLTMNRKRTMKLTALLLSLAALAPAAPARADNAALPGWQVRRLYLEQQDEARFRVCDAQRADNTATRSLDFTPAGRRCLIDALGHAASVQGSLVLLRNASATLRKAPEDHALRTAALRAVARARVQLASDLMPLRERFREEAAALDQAEFSIHLPQLHYEQQQWRLETYQKAMVEQPRQD
jgi:hypothetical protein